MTVLYVNPRLASYDVLDLSSHSPSEKKNNQHIIMVSTTNTITNHQLLTIKAILKNVYCSVLGHIPLGFISFNKSPIEGNQLPVETDRDHYRFH